MFFQYGISPTWISCTQHWILPFIPQQTIMNKPNQSTKSIIILICHVCRKKIFTTTHEQPPPENYSIFRLITVQIYCNRDSCWLCRNILRRCSLINLCYDESFTQFWDREKWITEAFSCHGAYPSIKVFLDVSFVWKKQDMHVHV
jgi:hypothetical protein